MGFSRRQAWIVVAAVVALSVIAGCSDGQVLVPVEVNGTSTVERADSGTETPPAQDASTGDAAAGQALFTGNSISVCTACHSTGADKVVGPGLAGVYERAGKRTALDADAYIEQSLREPQAFLVDGFPAAMPSFDQFSVGEVRDLIAYLKTLK